MSGRICHETGADGTTDGVTLCSCAQVDIASGIKTPQGCLLLVCFVFVGADDNETSNDEDCRSPVSFDDDNVQRNDGHRRVPRSQEGPTSR